VLLENNASNLRVLWRWWQYVPLKHKYPPTKVHSATNQKTTVK
jgi:hypothetical protein